jgi:hypothetical protein
MNAPPDPAPLPPSQLRPPSAAGGSFFGGISRLRATPVRIICRNLWQSIRRTCHLARSAFRWWLIVFVPVAVAAVSLLVLQAFLTLLHGRPQAVITDSPVTELIWGSGILVALAVTLLVARHRRPNPRNTTSVDEAIRDLKNTRKKYALLIRPFGRDGESAVTAGGWPGIPKMLPLFLAVVGLPGIPMMLMSPPRTLEQMAARAARNAADLQTYALVDQSQLRATAGPTWLRTPNEEWESAIEYLIERAHSIILILHPQHELRDGFASEIQMITRHDLQGRVVIVWPAEVTTSPLYADETKSPRYDICHRHAARILAAFAGADFNDLKSPQVDKWMKKLKAARALGVEIVSRDGGQTGTTRMIAIDRSRRFYFLEPDPGFYRHEISDAIRSHGMTFDPRSFTELYPDEQRTS